MREGREAILLSADKPGAAPTELVVPPLLQLLQLLCRANPERAEAVWRSGVVISGLLVELSARLVVGLELTKKRPLRLDLRRAQRSTRERRLARRCATRWHGWALRWRRRRLR